MSDKIDHIFIGEDEQNRKANTFKKKKKKWNSQILKNVQFTERTSVVYK